MTLFQPILGLNNPRTGLYSKKKRITGVFSGDADAFD
jgi:hypothetical protein